MISFHNVSFAYENELVLNDLSFSLPSRGVFRLNGPSGCGKTTLLRLLAELDLPLSGTITRPQDLTLSMVFQENRLLPWLTAEENVAFVCHDPHRVEQALKAVALWDDRHKRPDELSGGMQRRVAIARAIAYGGDVLILDEPFTGLDEQLCHTIADEICRAFADKLIVLVTHSDDEAAYFSATTWSLPVPLTGIIP